MQTRNELGKVMCAQSVCRCAGVEQQQQKHYHHHLHQNCWTGIERGILRASCCSPFKGARQTDSLLHPRTRLLVQSHLLKFTRRQCSHSHCMLCRGWMTLHWWFCCIGRPPYPLHCTRCSLNMAKVPIYYCPKLCVCNTARG